MKACVNKKLCIGCGLCTSIAEEVFRLGEDGKAEAYAEGEDGLVMEAIESCPVSAIAEE